MADDKGPVQEPEDRRESETIPMGPASGDAWPEHNDTRPIPPLRRPSEKAIEKAQETVTLYHKVPVSWPEVNAWLMTQDQNRKAFILHSTIAVGGNGEVFDATQVALGRRIAIKRLRPDLTSGDVPISIDRENFLAELFHQEAVITASLEHPNIVSVHDLGTDERGLPLLAMKMVRGKPWSDMIEEDRQLSRFDFFSRHLPILISVAQAIAFAHSRGVVHCDLKPAQVMIGEFGEVVLMDWGLAIVLETWPRLKGGPVPPPIPNPLAAQLPLGKFPNRARREFAAGTPAFMAPEQLESGIDMLGYWTDVYLLGGILYYLITCTPPHQREKDSSSPLDYWRAVPPPEQRAPGILIPAELSDLAQRSLQPNPAERQLTAQQFALELTDYLSGAGRRSESERITSELKLAGFDLAMGYRQLTESLTAVERALTLWPENPDAPSLREQLLIQFAQRATRNGDLVLANVQAQRIENVQRREEMLFSIDARQRVVRRREVERRVYLISGVGVLILLVLLGVRYVHDQGQARERADEARAQAITQKERAEREQYFAGIGFADSYLRQARPDKAFTTLMNDLPQDHRQWEWGALMAKIAPDDMTLLRGFQKDGKATFHSVFSPDGSKILTAHRGGVIIHWDAQSGRQIKQWDYAVKGIWYLRFDVTGTLLLAATNDGHAYILNAETGEKLLDIKTVRSGGEPTVRGLDLSPDGTRLVTTGNDDAFHVWDAKTGAQIFRVTLPHSTYDAQFSPDGKRIAVSLLGANQVLVVDAATGATVLTLAGHTASSLSVRFNKSGSKILTSCVDGFARLYDANTGELVRDVSVEGLSLRYAVFSPDESMIAASGNDGICRIWDAETGKLLNALQGAKQMEKVDFHSTKNLLLTNSFDEVKVWNLDRIQARDSLELPSVLSGQEFDQLRVASYPYDRGGVWAGYDDHWVTDGGVHAFRIGGNQYRIDSYNTLISPGDVYRLDIDFTSSAGRVHKGLTDGLIFEVPFAKVFNGAFNSDSTMLAVSNTEGKLAVYRTSDWKEVHTWSHPLGVKNTLWSMKFSPDGQRLALGWQRGSFAMMDVTSGAILYEIENAHTVGKPVVSMDFDPRGEMLVTASSDETARVWEAGTGAVISVLRGHELNVISAQFSKDGSRILTAGMDNKARLWEPISGREILTLFSVPPPDDMMGATFSKDGLRAIFPTRLGKIHVLESIPLEESAMPGTAELSFEKRLELWKRIQRVDKNSTADAIDW